MILLYVNGMTIVFPYKVHALSTESFQEGNYYHHHS